MGFVYKAWGGVINHGSTLEFKVWGFLWFAQVMTNNGESHGKSMDNEMETGTIPYTPNATP